MRRQDAGPRDDARRVTIAWLCTGAAVALVAARGGVDDPAVWLTSAAVVGLAVASVTSPHVSWPVAGFALLWLTCALQLVPLPPWLVGAAPGARRILELSLEPLKLWPTWRPSSMDAPATWGRLGYLFTCLAAVFLGSTLSASRSARRVLGGAIGLSGLVVALIQVATAVARGRAPLALDTPFVNPNHSAALLGLSAPILFVRGIGRDRRQRVGWWLAAALVSGMCVLTLSRGGVVGLAAGFATLALLAHLRREGLPAGTAQLAAVASLGMLVVLGAVVVLSWSFLSGEWSSVQGDLERSKLGLWTASLPMLREFMPLGAGAGAFPAVFGHYQVEADQVTYHFVENQWLQALLDHGVVLGPVGVVLVLWVWLGAARAPAPSWSRLGLLAGMAALGVHEAFDFATSVLGVGLISSLGLGLLAGQQRPLVLSPRLVRSLLVGGGALATTGFVLAARGTIDGVGPGLEAAPTAAAAEQLGRDAVRAHPAEWIPHHVVGARWARDGSCANGMPWLVRAMALAPTVPDPHLEAARCLARAGQEEFARREYRLAMSFGSLQAYEEAVAIWPRLPDLYAVVPDGPDQLRRLAGVLERRNPRLAADVFGRLHDEYGFPGSATRAARLWLAAREFGPALDRARAVNGTAEADAESFEVEASSLRGLDRPDEAAIALRHGLARLPGNARLVGALVDLELARRAPAAAEAALGGLVIRDAGDVAHRCGLEARIRLAQDRPALALRLAEQAVAAAPNSVAPRIFLADLLAGAGRPEEAIAEVRRAMALAGPSAHLYDGLLRRIEGQRRSLRAPGTPPVIP